MEFEWDNDKRETNIEKHGIDFIRAITMWRGDVIDPAAYRNVEGEIRILALGAIGDDDLVIAVVYTIRQGLRRVVRARRTRRNERRYYQNQFGHGD